jgi:hypothetical protein
MGHIIHRSGTVCLHWMKDSAKLSVDNPKSCLVWQVDLCLNPCTVVGQDSVVHIVTGCRLDSLGIEFP